MQEHPQENNTCTCSYMQSNAGCHRSLQALVHKELRSHIDMHIVYSMQEHLQEQRLVKERIMREGAPGSTTKKTRLQGKDGIANATSNVEVNICLYAFVSKLTRAQPN